VGSGGSFKREIVNIREKTLFRIVSHSGNPLKGVF
jgi:hypothetical protein